MTAES